MADALLLRRETSDEGTFGQFLAGELGRLRLYSGELPWRDNTPSVSHVPPAPGGPPVTYTAAFTWSPRFGRGLYLLAPSDPRAGIRLHPANFMGAVGLKCQLNGCIALGEKLGWMDGQKALLLSAPAVRTMEEYFGRRIFTLEITNAY